MRKMKPEQTDSFLGGKGGRIWAVPICPKSPRYEDGGSS